MRASDVDPSVLRKWVKDNYTFDFTDDIEFDNIEIVDQLDNSLGNRLISFNAYSFSFIIKFEDYMLYLRELKINNLLNGDNVGYVRR